MDQNRTHNRERSRRTLLLPGTFLGKVMIDTPNLDTLTGYDDILSKTLIEGAREELDLLKNHSAALHTIWRTGFPPDRTPFMPRDPTAITEALTKNNHYHTILTQCWHVVRGTETPMPDDPVELLHALSTLMASRKPLQQPPPDPLEAPPAKCQTCGVDMLVPHGVYFCPACHHNMEGIPEKITPQIDPLTLIQTFKDIFANWDQYLGTPFPLAKAFQCAACGMLSPYPMTPAGAWIPQCRETGCPGNSMNVVLIVPLSGNNPTEDGKEPQP